MKIIGEHGREDLAKVYVGSLRDGENHRVEFVESLQPPISRLKKWVLIISCSFGCPMKCIMCDAGGRYAGNLSEEEMLAQVDHMVLRRFPDGKVPVEKFKVQFARMGEPALNPGVLRALAILAEQYEAPGLMACLSTTAPARSDGFLRELTDLKNRVYPGGRFQLQFSIHTTDEDLRGWLMPGKKWDLETISQFGREFVRDGDRRIALNFAMTQDLPIDPDIIGRHFDPELFVIKLTPLNPTSNGIRHGLATALDPANPKAASGLKRAFARLGFEVILSIGESEENAIGSNCGQYVSPRRDTAEESDEGTLS